MFYQIYTLKDFHKSVACLLILLPAAFNEQMFFILIKSNLSICSFMDCLLSVMSKISLPNKRSQRVSSIFSFRRFVVLSFMVRSMIFLLS